MDELELLHVNARLLCKDHRRADALRPLHNAAEIIQIRRKQVSELLRDASRLQEVHHIESYGVLRNAVVSRNFRPIAWKLLHKGVVDLVVALIYTIARIVEDFPFHSDLTYDLMGRFLRFKLFAQFFKQFPFAHELVLLGIGRVHHFRHHIAVIRQHVLIDFANMEKWICRVFQNMRHLPERLFALIRLGEHFTHFILGEIDRQ